MLLSYILLCAFPRCCLNKTEANRRTETVVRCSLSQECEVSALSWCSVNVRFTWSLSHCPGGNVPLPRPVNQERTPYATSHQDFIENVDNLLAHIPFFIAIISWQRCCFFIMLECWIILQTGVIFDMCFDSKQYIRLSDVSGWFPYLWQTIIIVKWPTNWALAVIVNSFLVHATVQPETARQHQKTYDSTCVVTSSSRPGWNGRHSCRHNRPNVVLVVTLRDLALPPMTMIQQKNPNRIMCTV